MRRAHKKVSNPPAEKAWTRESAAKGVEQTLALLEGRWKLEILFQLFGGAVRRFSDLERAIPAVTQKMLAQQLRQLERDGIVTRKIYPEIPRRWNTRSPRGVSRSAQSSTRFCDGPTPVQCRRPVPPPRL